MNDSNIELKSVSDLNELMFNVPFYQRGYRWKQQQVKQLLEDLDSFCATYKNPFYFLQALVVAKRDGDANSYNVVDGQQRITTIKLILESETQASKPLSIEIEYERTKGGRVHGGDCVGLDGYYINQAKKEQERRLDEHYIKQAKKEIEDFIEKKTPEQREDFLRKVKASRFIFYEINAKDEQAVFSRLNSGKIKAKESELVKCILLTPGTDESRDVTNARAHEWDFIERALVDDHFFSFFARRNCSDENDRMSKILRYAGFNPKNEDTELFPILTEIQDEIAKTDSSRISVWRKIYSAYYKLLEWYNDPVMYHAFGWEVHRKNADKIEVKKIDTKKQDELNDYVYGENNNECLDLLLLYNVAYCWQRGMKYDFLKHREIDSWSLEHIFARNQKDLNEEEFKKFCPQDAGVSSKWNEYKSACEKGQGDKWLEDNLKELYPKDEDNSIRNLALLGKDANSSLNNNLFLGKRQLITKWDSDEDGYWVPPATRAVFFKSLPGLEPDVPYWSEPDKGKYSENIKDVVNAFIDAINKAKGQKE